MRNDNFIILESFFKAENARDWNTYKGFLHKNIQWILYNDSNGEIITGIDQYLEKMKSAYEGTSIQFTCKDSCVNKSGDRIMTVLINDDGDKSVDIFDFEDGLIIKEWEFII